ncbi:VCBS repeat-containing protein [Danxiaibacter flavus]|uniref:VCBS repeat-containing protein n=1 Tax=Danxiaibacter flavus TaxID=3049108 RepID=A0ABV3ZDU6_9BACT|nr:VCBS repeat-containing protein [Chitinophagaceae bacterium DXS]
MHTIVTSVKNWLTISCFSVLFFCSCSNDTSHLFTRLDKDKTGIHFQNTLFEGEGLSVLNYTYFYNGNGVAIGDINNDGLQDILFTGNMVKNRLYLNKGNFEFEDITAKSGVADKQGWCTGATMADVNGDGKLDIYICRSADVNPQRRKNLLFINNGDLTFTEKAEEYGLADQGYSTQASFFDYDKDGDLDCFIINHSLQKYTTGAQENPELRNQRNPDFANKLYRNDNGHFTNVSEQAGITSNVFTFGLGLAVSDINNDGWPDVYVSNDFNEPDYLFINNRNGTFSEALNKCMDQVSLYSMGSDVADFNNDGKPDIITLDMLPEDNLTQKMHSGAENFDKFQYLFSRGFFYQYSRNMLQKNNGDGTFSEIGQLAGISNTDWSWSALMADYDNDGNKDLFVSNGYVKDYTDMDFIKYSIDRAAQGNQLNRTGNNKDFIDKMPANKIANYIFKNNGDETFTKKTDDWGMSDKSVSSGAAYADLDNDGDLDMIVCNTNDFAGIYKNNSEALSKNNFLRIQLTGIKTNSIGTGTKVKVYCRDTLYYQEQMPVRGFQSSVDPVLNFGLGQHSIVDSIIIIWPNDQYQKLQQVKTNQTLAIKQTDAHDTWTYDTVRPVGYFSSTSLDNIRHKENQFNDFTIQTLLPNYLSRQGPCIISADINKDGLDDIFVGGAKQQPSSVYLQNKQGSFTKTNQPAIAADSLSEDVAATFFDADNDGDPDLYVAAGGYEFNENDPLFQDRLYMNDGKGNFTKNQHALPALTFSKGCVKAADIDGDGDMDLFVGGRLIPGKYPSTPPSKLLINDGKGTFTDQTAKLAPGLANIGMVTSAAWLDVNNDQQPDLVVTGEWMPVKVFINNKGALSDASSAYIQFPSTGWWNTITAEDMDGDGDLDLIVGNCGTNTQFKASEKKPVTVYYKDFDGNGSIDPIVCYYINGVSYPVYSRDDLTDQLPSLKKKFLEYHEYASASIKDVFPPEQLNSAGFLKAENMRTVYLENRGTNGFIQHNLPVEAQYAPVYSIVITDANNDGKKDILLTGNNSWTRIKFGRYTANHGVLLLGDGKGNFSYAPQYKSGLQLKGNVRSAAVINNNKIIVGVNDGAAILLQLKIDR